jgi:hypothetical protein
MYTIIEYSCIPGCTTYVAHHGIFKTKEDAMAQLDEWVEQLTLYDCLASNETLYRSESGIAIRDSGSGTLHLDLWVIAIF